jgi:hypothetical protein
VAAGREGEAEKGAATETDKKSFNYATGEIQVSYHPFHVSL